MSPDDPRHGTHAGRRAHERDGQPACTACRQSNALYQRRYRKVRALYGDRMLPALGTARRVQALNRLGWSTPAIAEVVGMSGKQLWMTTQQTIVSRQVAARIAAAYDELSMTLPPTDTKSRRISVGKVRAHAEREGYPPPLAWDDIDEPDEQPNYGGADSDVDPVVVMRLLEGQRVKATKAEKEAAMEQWVADGGSRRELASWHGWKAERYTAGLRLVKGGAA